MAEGDERSRELQRHFQLMIADLTSCFNPLKATFPSNDILLSSLLLKQSSWRVE